MDITEMKDRKRELGYSNKRLAELSGVPLGTVQKIFSGATKAPREDSLKKIRNVLYRNNDTYSYDCSFGVSNLREDNLAYKYDSEQDVPDVLIDAKTRRWRRQGTYTVSDYEMLPENFRVELIDGSFFDPASALEWNTYALASPLQIHQVIVGSIFARMFDFIETYHPDCFAFMAPSSVKLEDGDKTMVEPDLFVVCDKSKLNGKWVDGAPDLVVEVLSPSTATIDQIIKLNKYWKAGVREYWIVDSAQRRIMVYRFDEGTPPESYTFDDTVPVGISGGELKIDFSAISRRIELLS